MNSFTCITTYIYDNISLWLVFVSEAEYVFSDVKYEAEENVYDLYIITEMSTEYTISFRVR
jgi:hypothetical protein